MSTAPAPRPLHVVPGHSARGSLREAMRSIGRDVDVLAFGDDLSCDPIDPDDADMREAWWNCDEEGSVRDGIRAFWDEVASTDRRLVVSFGRHAAFDPGFVLHWVDRLGDRPYHVIDVTGLRPVYRDREGQAVIAGALVGVGLAPTPALPAAGG